MTKVAISSVINAGFINSFTGLASGKSSGADLAKALSGGGASKVTIGQGLRLGAQAFGTAVQNLNSLATFLNVGENILLRLSDVTDSMIELTQTATKAGTGLSQRRKLVSQFEDLAKEFRDIVSNAKFGKKQVLKEADIEELFISLGLDRKKSQSIAELFAKFETFGTDKILVGPEQGNTEPLRVPASAFQSSKTIMVGDLSSQKLSDSSPLTAAASSSAGGGAVLNGTTLTPIGAAPVNDIDILHGSSQNGNYLVVQSSLDPLGYNWDNNPQLFLMNAADGAFLQQLTINGDPTALYLSASVSNDGLTVGFVIDAAVGYGALSSTFGALGTDPNLVVPTVHEFLPAKDKSLEALVVSSDGSHIAYRELDGLGDSRLVLRDTATSTRNADLYRITNQHEGFDFIDTNQLAIARQVGSNYDIISFSASSSSSILASNVGSVGSFAAIEGNSTSNNSYYFTYINPDTEMLYLHREGTGLVSLTSVAGASPINMSLVGVDAGNEAVAIGYFGILPGDADNELYRFTSSGENPLKVNTRLAPATSAIGDILNSGNKLLRRPDAYRMLHDLNGLKEQLEGNIDALKNARLAVLDNIDLVRTAGFAFLELSSQISSDEEADQVARLVRNEIRKAPIKALAQAENLQAIAVAALTTDSSGNDLDS